MLAFANFLNEKIKLFFSSNLHLWEIDGEDKDDSDWVTDNDSVMNDAGESDKWYIILYYILYNINNK